VALTSAPAFAAPLPQASSPVRTIRPELRTLLRALHRNRTWVAAILAAALLAGCALTLLTTPRYVAVASVRMDQQGDRAFDTAAVEARTSSDADGFLQTQADVLRSRSLSLRVARRLRLLDEPSFFAAMAAAPPPDGPSAAARAQRREAVLTLLKTHLSVDVPRNSRVATIAYTSADPGSAARIANAYASEFLLASRERELESSAEAREFLSRQIASARLRLEQSERALNAYARAAQLIRTGGEGRGAGASESITSASLAQLNAAANEARAGRIAAEQKWRSVAGSSLLSIPEVLANPAVQRLLEQRAAGAAEIQRERVRHLSDYPSVRQLETQQAEIERQATGLAVAIRSSLYDQYRDAAGREQALAAQVEGLKGATLAEQDRSVQYTILAREADTNRTLYEGLLQRFKTLTAAAGGSTSNLSILDRAEPPLTPSAPSLLLNVLAALAGGLVIAGAAVLAREHLDDALRSPEEVETRLGLPLLGAIPRVRAMEVANLDTSTPANEAYAALAGALLHATPRGLPRTLLVTSAEPGEGKSTSSIAIADALARLGKRVVLVDADLRRPALERMLGVVRPGGLSGVVLRQVPLDWAIQPAASLGFAVLASGGTPPSPSELLGGAGMADTLASLAERFDVVVLDGPPVLGLADAPMLASQVEATLVVVAADRRSPAVTEQALRRLHAGGGAVLGVLLTKFDLRGSRLGRAYYGAGYRQAPPAPAAPPAAGRARTPLDVVSIATAGHRGNASRGRR
jgi:capsular exopolysaccharide synthesis family protein